MRTQEGWVAVVIAKLSTVMVLEASAETPPCVALMDAVLGPGVLYTQEKEAVVAPVVVIGGLGVPPAPQEGDEKVIVPVVVLPVPRLAVKTKVV